MLAKSNSRLISFNAKSKQKHSQQKGPLNEPRATD